MTDKTPRKPILVLDFDGVLHSYTSGWQGATVINDPPTPGMVPFLHKAVDAFDVQILSSRSKDPGGIKAMQRWLHTKVCEHYDCLYHTGAPRDFANAQEILTQIKFPIEKPAAFLTLDDRAITFTGKWPDIETLKGFTPWNEKPNSPSHGSTTGANRRINLIHYSRRVLTLIFRMGRS
jgi:hypothetical protein